MYKEAMYSCNCGNVHVPESVYRMRGWLRRCELCMTPLHQVSQPDKQYVDVTDIDTSYVLDHGKDTSTMTFYDYMSGRKATVIDKHRFANMQAVIYADKCKYAIGKKLTELGLIRPDVSIEEIENLTIDTVGSIFKERE